MKPMRPSPACIAQTPLGPSGARLARSPPPHGGVEQRRLINTAAGYRAFLAKFPDSDLTATARKLEERLRNRPDLDAGRCRRHAALPQNVALAADLSLQLQPPAATAAEEGRCARSSASIPIRRSGRSQAAARAGA